MAPSPGATRLEGCFTSYFCRRTRAPQGSAPLCSLRPAAGRSAAGVFPAAGAGMAEAARCSRRAAEGLRAGCSSRDENIPASDTWRSPGLACEGEGSRGKSSTAERLGGWGFPGGSGCLVHGALRGAVSARLPRGLHPVPDETRRRLDGAAKAGGSPRPRVLGPAPVPFAAASSAEPARFPAPPGPRRARAPGTPGDLLGGLCYASPHLYSQKSQLPSPESRRQKPSSPPAVLLPGNPRPVPPAPWVSLAARPAARRIKHAWSTVGLNAQAGWRGGLLPGGLRAPPGSPVAGRPASGARRFGVGATLFFCAVANVIALVPQKPQDVVFFPSSSSAEAANRWRWSIQRKGLPGPPGPARASRPRQVRRPGLPTPPGTPPPCPRWAQSRPGGTGQSPLAAGGASAGLSYPRSVCSRTGQDPCRVPHGRRCTGPARRAAPAQPRVQPGGARRGCKGSRPSAPRGLPRPAGWQRGNRRGPAGPGSALPLPSPAASAGFSWKAKPT
ncbi:phosphatidylethanolamine-binding protein 4 isoform X2 [Struthio camelus]|uniref:phosphatidylethanolamine-binding protein 4 isoform X2 n=1 Tax=Struthio camelus TaxID=8801 RepID=UPI003603CC39